MTLGIIISKTVAFFVYPQSLISLRRMVKQSCVFEKQQKLSVINN